MTRKETTTSDSSSSTQTTATSLNAGTVTSPSASVPNPSLSGMSESSSVSVSKQKLAPIGDTDNTTRGANIVFTISLRIDLNDPIRKAEFTEILLSLKNVELPPEIQQALQEVNRERTLNNPNDRRTDIGIALDLILSKQKQNSNTTKGGREEEELKGASTSASSSANASLQTKSDQTDKDSDSVDGKTTKNDSVPDLSTNASLMAQPQVTSTSSGTKATANNGVSSSSQPVILPDQEELEEGSKDLVAPPSPQLGRQNAYYKPDIYVTNTRFSAGISREVEDRTVEFFRMVNRNDEDILIDDKVIGLLNQGIDFNARFNGQTPLLFITQSNSVNALKALRIAIDKRADVNQKVDNHGNSPLHSCVTSDNKNAPEMVSLLLTRNAYPNAKTNSNQTPLDLLKNKGSTKNPASILTSFLRDDRTILPNHMSEALRGSAAKTASEKASLIIAKTFGKSSQDLTSETSSLSSVATTFSRVSNTDKYASYSVSAKSLSKTTDKEDKDKSKEPTRSASTSASASSRSDEDRLKPSKLVVLSTDRTSTNSRSASSLSKDDKPKTSPSGKQKKAMPLKGLDKDKDRDK